MMLDGARLVSPPINIHGGGSAWYVKPGVGYADKGVFVIKVSHPLPGAIIRWYLAKVWLLMDNCKVAVYRKTFRTNTYFDLVKSVKGAIEQEERVLPF